MRTAFIEQLIVEATTNERIFLVVGDLGYSVVEKFAEMFPDRYINVGVAEQNMAGVASGLALSGYIVYIYSIGNFPTLRCMEQIRYDIAYHQLSVRIVAVGGGYSYGSLGPSHHATEEIGMLRTIPNMVICAPGDPVETKAITSWSAKYEGSVYIRIGKAGEPIVHTSGVIPIQIGMPIIVLKKNNCKFAIFSTGSMLKYVVDYIESNQLSADVFSIPFVKPLDKDAYKVLLKQYKRIVTIEEHQASCGMGSAILELCNDLTELNELVHVPSIRRIAIPDTFISTSGSQQYLRMLSGLVLKEDYFL